ncbi:MAG: zinc-ribbon domain-containing protein [Oscillospiraceae bacterium]|nr:zinc-ribbon domain-containing protein [Oscillospiraceae bacterium]
MLFDDDNRGGIRGVFDAAAERTAGAIQGSKAMIERTRIRAQLNDAYRKYGKAAYEASVNGVDTMEELNKLSARISELRQTLLGLDRSLQKSGTITCSKCGRLNSSNDSFCPSCGTSLR